MNLRRPSRSISSLYADLRSAMRSPSATSTGDDERADETPTSPTSSLFQCPECDDVFVAVEKSTCASCDVPVVGIASPEPQQR